MSAVSEKTDSELAGLLEELRTKVQQFRFATAGSKTKNVKEGRGFRREIARVLTEQRSRVITSRASLLGKTQSARRVAA